MFRIISIALVAAALVLFAVSFGKEEKTTNATQAQSNEKKSVPVKVQTFEESRQQQRNLEYPAVVTSQGEAAIVASVSGTAAQVLFKVGDRVSVGQLLVRIDEPENGLDPENGFKSAAIQQAQIAADQARKSYDQAKRTYDKDKTKANKTLKDIAKLDYESAQISLQNAYDARLIKSPIAGIVTAKHIENGSTVNANQTLATISPSKDVVAKFSVNQSELGSIAPGTPVTIVSGRQSFGGKVSSVSPQADNTTGKFMIEAKPNDPRSSSLLPGTVTTVLLVITDKPHQAGAILLPLSAVTTGQNESFIFIENNGIAKKVPVSVLHIAGESAEVTGDIPAGSRILIEGNKLVQDGDPVTIR